MAEAMCGPSNALQQFKQRSDVDRTLQQDRLAARQHQHPAQSFRSPNPHAGALDPQFEAFQAGHDFTLPEQVQVQPFHRPTAFAAAPQAPSWATDFQRLQISQPPPLQQQHLQSSPSTANWAQGFREHVAQAAPRAQSSSPSPQAFQQRARFGLTGFQSQFSQPSYASAVPLVQSKGKAPVTDQFDEAAFAAAFDQARDDLMAETEEQTQEDVPTAQELIEEVEVEKFEALVEEAATDMLREAGHDMDIEEYTNLSKVHSGGDIEYEPMQALQEEEKREQKQQHDDDALAATAEELLEKVKDNQSEKFRNSQFLGLMRKLRDREMRVEGDKMVETEKGSSTTSHADTTLNASSTTDYSNRVYYGKPQPAPLPVDTRPPEYGIPPNEQDYDQGRIDPRDGQEVVDMLNSGTEDMAYDPSYSESYASASPNWTPF